MSTKANILKTLKQTPLLSGEQLAKQLNISRNAVWKAIHAMNNDGFIIESTTNGYRFISQPKTLNATVLQSAFLDDIVFVYDTIDSTNTQAKIHADKLTGRGIFIAKQQTAGKGRNGRQFYSPQNSGIYISVLYPAETLQKYLTLVTPLAAVAITRAIQSVLQLDVGIKWVNDIFFNNKKVAGILTEALFSVEAGTVDKVIIGMGINVTKPENLPTDLTDIMGYLSDTPIDMNTLAIAVIEELLTLLTQLPNCDFMTIYKKHSIVLNQNITVHQGELSYPAIATAITDEGHLVITKADGSTENLQHGEISIRLN